MNLWHFIHNQDIIVEEKEKKEKKREGNQLIVKSFIKNDKTTHNMNHLNRCHLSLNVTTLSDILEGDVITINKDALQGVLQYNKNSQYKFPNHIQPYEKAWTT